MATWCSEAAISLEFLLLLVVILGVVFTLGYLLGRSQYDVQLNPSVEAAIRQVDELAGKTEKAAPPSQPPAADDSAGSCRESPHGLGLLSFERRAQDAGAFGGAAQAGCRQAQARAHRAETGRAKSKRGARSGQGDGSCCQV